MYTHIHLSSQHDIQGCTTCTTHAGSESRIHGGTICIKRWNCIQNSGGTTCITHAFFKEANHAANSISRIRQVMQ